jgi:murein L,D-transpeptidase YcbB/YkuD
MDRKVYTYLSFPFKTNDEDDSLLFVKTIQKRLIESNCVDAVEVELLDSLELNSAIKKYQKKKGIKVDGKVSGSLVRSLNLTDVERFKRIAITLDRYKRLPAVMPEKYIWVNLPAYYLRVWDHDSIALESKIICGKPDTRTPLLYSVISDMVTYPTWTVPNSIIAKQYLPKLKTNPNYLSRIGLRLVNNKGETIDAGTVNWSKYNKGIPYNVVQASGDGNALGIMKFNFNNPFSVYLHDTNQRYLFDNSSRALSHGCVRVQKWEQLAFYISRNDSLNLKEGDDLLYNTDSIKNWLRNKVKKRIPVKNGIPLFITYFCCEGKGDKIRFYEDIYGEDKLMREKCFSDK